MLNNIFDIIKHIIRLSLGAFFIVTAVLKLLSIDNFEVYIYSFNIVDFVTTTFLSRLLISIELFIGLSLIFNICHKQIWLLTLLMMAGFTLFLVYAGIFRNDSNCHCFGSLIELDPWQSIIKNIIVLASLFVIRKETRFKTKILSKPKTIKWIFGIIVSVSIAIPFVMVPMDAIYNKIYSDKENINTIVFYESLRDSTYTDFLNTLPEKAGDTMVFVHETRLMCVNEGRYIINYALAGCGYCRVGAEKLRLMLDKHDVSHEKVKFVLGGSDMAVSNFIRHTQTFDYEHWKIAASKMMSVTFGKFPLYVFVEDGKIVKTGDFRMLNDKEVTRFLNQIGN